MITSHSTVRSAGEIVKMYRDVYTKRYGEHGDHHLALNWTKEERVGVRHRVMRDVVKKRPCTLLDFGCGLGHMLDYVELEGIDYSGLDITPKFLERCRDKYPGIDWYDLNVCKEDEYARLPAFDYIVINGVFTEKLDVDYDHYWAYARDIIRSLWHKCTHGIAFNLMSTHLDWLREDLFHVPLDQVAAFVTNRLTRNFVIRNDYGLWEYTVYVYR